MNYIELKNTFTELLYILKRFKNQNIRYHINEIERALCIIESDPYFDKKEMEHIIRSLYRPKGALAEFYVWDDDVEDISERKRINQQLSDLKNALWNYVNSE